MKIRRALACGLSAGALVLTGCSTANDDNADGSTSSESTPGSSSSKDIRIDVITHGAPGDPFWAAVRAGAAKAGKDEGVALKSKSAPTSASRRPSSTTR